MTNQAVFDICVTHLRKQGCKSMGLILFERSCSTDASTSICLYRGSNGTKCAAGIFIPDEKYSSRMEGSTVYKIAYIFEGQAISTKFLRCLQRVHDMMNIEDWEMEFIRVARENDLTVPPFPAN